MKIPPVKGTRDFYPPEMAVRNFIVDGWKTVSVRNGFAEYDGPIFEYLKMFQIKSGQEIASQLFSLKDRAGRELAIRPEITPTLARMVNQKINSLPKPVKWFSVPRLCRAERPQKGRLREFFQWNVDIIGIDDVLADAEVIFCAVDYLQQVGLGPEDIVVKISSRSVLGELLLSAGVSDGQLESLYAVLDKRNKIPADVFEKILAEEITDKIVYDNIVEIMDAESIEQLKNTRTVSKKAEQSLDELTKLFELLNVMGISPFCEFDISIVRGLAYYTGVVFEICDRAGLMRAIGGGGRFDNLLKLFGGPKIPATGFGIGDCVLEILLRQKGLLEKHLPEAKLDYFVAVADKQFAEKAIEITARLRRSGLSASFSYKSVSLGKQFKQASACNAAKVIIVGAEIRNNQLTVKDMATGRQDFTEMDKFFAQL